MLIALAVLAALEAAPPPVAAVELIRSGAPGAPVNAAPRTLSDVARERREGRRAVGGFSAVETTVSGGSYAMPAFTWVEEETRPEPEVVPGREPPGEPGPYATAWGGWGGWPGGAPRRRPHVSHFARPSALPAPNAGHGPASRAGAGPVSLPATHAEGIAMRGATRRP
jgi:hypothetical protein